MLDFFVISIILFGVWWAVQSENYPNIITAITAIVAVLQYGIAFVCVQISAFYISDSYNIRSDFYSINGALRIIIPVIIVAVLFSVLEGWLAYKTAQRMLVAQTVLVIVFCLLWRILLFKRIYHGGRVKKVAIVGRDRVVDLIYDVVRTDPLQKYELVETACEDENELGDYLSKEKETRSAALENADIIVLSTETSAKYIEFLPFKLLKQKIYDANTFYSMLGSRLPLSGISREMLLSMINNSPTNKPIMHVTKRLFDIVFSFLLLVLMSPLLLLAMVLTRLDSSGPILFKQGRLGLKGKMFTCIKFRTMEHSLEEGNKAIIVEKSNKRITRVGKVLRDTHIDEIPNFINVLLGHMSVIGPRPVNMNLEYQLQKEVPFYNLRYLVKPGVTGWATINYYNTQEVDSKASISDVIRLLEYDVFYICNYSLILDFYILLKTIKISLLGALWSICQNVYNRLPISVQKG